MRLQKWFFIGVVVSVLAAVPALAFSAETPPLEKTVTSSSGCWVLGDLRGCVYDNRDNVQVSTGGNNLGAGITIGLYADNVYCLLVPGFYQADGITINQDPERFEKDANCYKHTGNEVWRIDFGLEYNGPRGEVLPPTRTPDAVLATDDNGCWYDEVMKGCIFRNDNRDNASTGGNNLKEAASVSVYGSEYCVNAPFGMMPSGYNTNQDKTTFSRGSRCYTHDSTSKIWRVDFGVEPFVAQVNSASKPVATATPTPEAVEAAATMPTATNTAAPTMTPTAAAENSVASAQPKAEVLSVAKVGECAWEIHFKITNFTPNTDILEWTNGTETDCATGVTQDVIITAEFGKFVTTDANGSAEWIVTVKEYGTYNATFTDRAGKSASTPYTVTK